MLVVSCSLRVKGIRTVISASVMREWSYLFEPDVSSLEWEGILNNSNKSIRINVNTKEPKQMGQGNYRTYKLLLHLQVFSDPRIRSYRNHKNSKEHKSAKNK